MLQSGRVTSARQDGLVVFFIGMRINRLHRPDKWIPVAMAMQRMLAELGADPDSGFLGYETLLKGLRAPCVLQYWRDFDSLERYAHAAEREHRPAWAEFNRKVAGNGAVGIFHETYVVRAGAYETVYANMPPFGLGKVSGVVPATGSRNAARARMGAMTDE